MEMKLYKIIRISKIPTYIIFNDSDEKLGSLTYQIFLKTSSTFQQVIIIFKMLYSSFEKSDQLIVFRIFRNHMYNLHSNSIQCSSSNQMASLINLKEIYILIK